MQHLDVISKKKKKRKQRKTVTVCFKGKLFHITFSPSMPQAKGDQSWVFIGRTDTEAETPVLWPPHVKSCLIGKDPDAGKDCGQEETGATEDEMVGWHLRLNGHEFE